jgi:preprotein translocase subunit SecG
LASGLLLGGADEKLLPINLSEDFMKKSLWFIGALVLFLSVGIALSAQTTPQTQSPDAQAQQPATPDQTPAPAPTDQAQANQTPSQTPEHAQPSPTPSQQATPESKTESATGVQSFTGTVAKSGDKYVLQDADTGNTYDVDHQDEVAKFEGKRVKVHGTLDASGKMIHIQ